MVLVHDQPGAELVICWWLMICWWRSRSRPPRRGDPYRTSAKPTTAPPGARLDLGALLARVRLSVTVALSLGAIVVPVAVVLIGTIAVAGGTSRMSGHLFALLVMVVLVEVLCIAVVSFIILTVIGRNRVALERPVWTKEHEK